MITRAARYRACERTYIKLHRLALMALRSVATGANDNGPVLGGVA